MRLMAVKRKACKWSDMMVGPARLLAKRSCTTFLASRRCWCHQNLSREASAVCVSCFGGHGDQLKAIEVLMAWNLWCHVALYDCAPCANAHRVMVLKQGCELGQELTVQLEAAVFS